LNSVMTMRLALLGDSIAVGVGAAHPSHALSHRLRTALQLHGIDAETKVFARSGARSAHLAPQVRRALAWQPHLALVVIGANDLTHLVPHDVASEHLGQAVRELRAGQVGVVVAPAPDLSMLPHVPPVMRPVVQEGSLTMRTAQVKATLAAGGRVADGTADTSTSFGTDPALFSGDRFHPSSAGYEVIAAALLPAVLEAATATMAP
jgi:lysophospholipase L1-like esterase